MRRGSCKPHSCRDTAVRPGACSRRLGLLAPRRTQGFWRHFHPRPLLRRQRESVAMAGPRRGKREKDSVIGARILIVEARYYDDLADLLLAGAVKVLKQAGAEVERITVPGSLEIPGAIAIAIEAGRRSRRSYDGVVALG